jgi:hypothetical protein
MKMRMTTQTSIEDLNALKKAFEVYKNQDNLLGRMFKMYSDDAAKLTASKHDELINKKRGPHDLA